jgi:hypothetical protein
VTDELLRAKVSIGDLLEAEYDYDPPLICINRYRTSIDDLLSKWRPILRLINIFTYFLLGDIGPSMTRPWHE